MEKLFVLIGATLLIGFILWWFFGKRQSSETEAVISENNKQEVEVTVSGGYTPNTVVLKQVYQQILFLIAKIRRVVSRMLRSQILALTKSCPSESSTLSRSTQAKRVNINTLVA